MTVAAVIPTILGRESSLAAAVASVHAQTVPVDELIVQLDADGAGPAATRNRAVAVASSTWLAFLDDDDVWLPRHVETLLGASDGADVVYPDCQLVGPHNGLILNVDFSPSRLVAGNFIPVTALVRRSLFNDVGGFDERDRYEDWGLWLRLLNAGASFRRVPTVTWEYRWHGDQRTFAA